MLARELRKFTAQEYLEFEVKAAEKNEYVDGQIYAKAGAKIKHNVLAANLLMTIGAGLVNKDCMAVGSDQRVKNPTGNFFTYPDVVVWCGKANLDKFDSLENPLLLIEILSRSTEEYDRGLKFERYQQIESLQEYILVSQEEKKIEKFERKKGQWIYAVYREAQNLTLSSIDLEIALDAIYAKSQELEPG